jgi:hypothetical protein
MAPHDLHTLFPRTFLALKQHNAESQIEQFLESNLPEHWFAPFLRQNKLPAEIFELAQYEWILQELLQAPASSPFLAREFLTINPNLKIIYFSTDQTKLHFVKGLWAFWPAGHLQLSENQALLLDLLGEERKFNELTLLERASLERPGVHFQKDLEVLCENGVILK